MGLVELPDGVGHGKLAAALSERRALEYVEPNMLAWSTQTPNDTSYASQQWSLNNTGQGGGTSNADINAPEAWDVTTGNTGIVAGVLDSGVDYTHPDLYLNIWINQGEIPTSRRSNLTDTDGDGLITFIDLNAKNGGGTFINVGANKISDVNADSRIDGTDVLSAPSGQNNELGGWRNGQNEDSSVTDRTDDLIGWNFPSIQTRPRGTIRWTMTTTAPTSRESSAPWATMPLASPVLRGPFRSCRSRSSRNTRSGE
jgi:subtilisin family serine protease